MDSRLESTLKVQMNFMLLDKLDEGVTKNLEPSEHPKHARYLYRYGKCPFLSPISFQSCGVYERGFQFLLICCYVNKMLS